MAHRHSGATMGTRWQRQLREKQRVCWLVSPCMRIQDTGPPAALMSCAVHFMRFLILSWIELTQEKERSPFLTLPAPPLEASSECHTSPLGSIPPPPPTTECPP